MHISKRAAKEQKKQKAKEDAVRLATKHGGGLVRRDLEVWMIGHNIEDQLIVKASDYDTLWQEALEKLKIMDEK